MNAPQLTPQDMDRLSRLSYELAHNPKTRAHFASLVAAVDPQSARAFTDVAVENKLRQFKAELDKEKFQEKTQLIAAQKENQKRQVIQKYGYNGDQAKALEDIRTKYGISDWDAAARIYSTFNPPENPNLKPPPEMLDGANWEFPTVPGPDGKMLEFKDYIKDPRRFSNRTAYQMITEFKRGKLPAAFHA